MTAGNGAANAQGRSMTELTSRKRNVAIVSMIPAAMAALSTTGLINCRDYHGYLAAIIPYFSFHGL
jgi:hypothetical protein